MVKNISYQAIGRIGELATEIELLRRGWLVGNFNSSIGNCAAYDLFAAKDGKDITIRCKAFSLNCWTVRYCAKPNGKIFLNLKDKKTDLTVITGVSEEKGPECFYIVPTIIIDEIIKSRYSKWIKGCKRDGGVRKNTSIRCLKLKGKNSLEKEFSKYLNNWDILK